MFVPIRRKHTGDAEHRAHLIFRLIEAHVQARFPVILLVGAESWWSFDKEAGAQAEPNAHAVAVVGVQGRSRDINSNALVCHDPGYRPYFERSFRDCLAAAENYGEKGVVPLIFAADRGIKLHAYQCIEWLKDYHCGKFFDNFTPSNKRGEADYRIRLVHRDDLVNTLYPDGLRPESVRHAAQFHENLVGLTRRGRYWCVTTHRRQGLSEHWLFAAETAPAKIRHQDLKSPILGDPVLCVTPSGLRGRIRTLDPDAAAVSVLSRCFYETTPPQAR